MKNHSYLLNPKNKLLANYDFEKDQNDCVPCTISNLKIKKFGTRNNTIASKVLELIHTDICGPFDPTIFGEKYYITFTDDFSRYLTIYLLKSKDESIKMFQIYKNMAETLHNGSKIIKIHSDRGGEYTSNKWKEFCEKEGIQISFSPRKTPQLNAVAESANRIVNWKIRAVLADSGLPKEYWGFAAKVCALYKNMSPTSKKEFTPFEYWFGKKPNLKMLRVFGCICFYKEPSSPKFEPQTNKGILLGYDEHLSSYCVMNMSTRTIIHTREAKFDENTYPQLENETQSSLNNEIDYDDGYSTPPKTKSIPVSSLKTPIPIPIEQKNNEIDRTLTINIPTPNFEFISSKTPAKTPVNTPKQASNTPKQGTNTPIQQAKTPTKVPEQSAKTPAKPTTVNEMPAELPAKPQPIPFSLDKPAKASKQISKHKELKLITEGKIKLGKRTIKPNPKFALTMVDEPQSYAEAINSEQKELWQTAMEQEIASLAKNNTWQIIPKPLV